MTKKEVASRVFRVLATVAFLVALIVLLEAPGLQTIAYLLISVAYALKEDP